MKKLVLVVMFCLLPLAALAAEVAANPVGDAMAGLLTNVVFPVLAALLLGLVGVVLNKIRQKWGIDISAATEERIEDAARRGIQLAEEKAAAAIKANVTKLTGKEKLDLAVAHVLGAVPKVSPEQAEAVIHAVLGSRWMRAGASATVPPGSAES